MRKQNRPNVRTLAMTLVAATAALGFAADASAQSFEARFPENLPPRYLVGSGVHLPIQVEGVPGDEGDVRVQAYSDAAGPIAEFTHELTAPPWRISADKLALLPEGRIELTIFPRTNRRPLGRDTVVINVVPRQANPDPDPDPQPQPENPTVRIGFGGSFPDTYTRGSGEPINLHVPLLPDGAQVVVQAYLESDGRIFHGFTHTLTQAPFRIEAPRLDRLPPGGVEFRLTLRKDGEALAVSSKSLEVRLPVLETVMPTVAFRNAPETWMKGSNRSIELSLSDPLPEGADVLMLAWSDERSAMVDGFAVELDGAPFVVPASELEKLPVGAVVIQAMLRKDNEPQARVNWDMEVVAPPAPATVAWASGSPSVYNVGSGTPIDFTVAGQLSPGQDVLVIAWSDAQRKLVDGFAPRFTAPPYRLTTNQLDRLPAGTVELQLLLRTNNRIESKVARDIIVVRPGGGGNGEDPDGEDPDTENPGGGEDPDTENPGGPTDPLPNTGWTSFSRASDARVIYVDVDSPGVNDSVGSDNNDGLSPQRALATVGKGYGLLRDGQPDWLVFKRGDVIRSGLGSWTKSGRSAAQPMVVTSYGDANQPRPRFEPDGADGLNAMGGTTVRNIAFVDLHFYAYTRDPDNRAFNGGRTRNFGIRLWSQVENFTFEGVLVEFFANNVDFNGDIEAKDTYNVKNITFRRCVIRNAYLPNDIGHSQGMGAGRVDGLTLIENVFDHNGWNDKVARAHRTMFNHNIYIHENKNVLLDGNLWARGSTMAVKLRSDEPGKMQNVVIRNNFFVDSKECVGMGGEALRGGASSMNLVNVQILRNVCTMIGEPSRTDQLGRAFILKQVGNARVEDNIIVHKTYPTQWAAIEVAGDRPWEDVAIRRNIVHNWYVTDPSRWLRAPGEVVRQSNLVFQPDSTYVDASRNINKYLVSVGESSLDSFLDKARTLRIGNWDDKYAAAGPVRYFRQGFTATPHD